MTTEKLSLNTNASDMCMDDLLNTRDIATYLDSLISLREKYIIIMCIKDTPGSNVSEEVFGKIGKLGFSNLTKDWRRPYVGVIDCGNVVFNKSGAVSGDPIEYEFETDNSKFAIKSASYLKGNCAQITINGTDYSLNGRSWNFVVFDRQSDAVVDSSTFDVFAKAPTFYHKNLDFDGDFFKNHFYIPSKYIDLWTEPYTKRYNSNRKMEAKVVEYGIVLPEKRIEGRTYGGVCDKDFNYISGHTTNEGEYDRNARNIVGSYKVEMSELDYVDETVVYGGIMIDHMGHMIIECFAERIWWYVKNPNSGYRVVIENRNHSTGGHIKEYLDLFGFSDEDIIWINKPTKFRKIIVPEQSNYLLTSWSNEKHTWSLQPTYEYTNEYFSVFQHCKKNLNPSPFKKIYFTKRDGRGNIIGEEFFIDFYKSHGYKIIDPVSYSLKEKVEFLMGADEFVSVIGTNTHYAIFCKPTVKLVLLSRTDDNPCPSQYQCTQAVGITDFYCVHASLNFFHKEIVYGATLMYPTKEFQQYAQNEFNYCVNIDTKEYIKKNLFEYLSFCCRYYSNRNFFNQIKNQKMLTILQNMSEVFLGKEFDTSKLDLTTNEDNLRNQVKQLTEDLNASKKRVTELENSDVYKAARLLEATNGKLEKQVAELQSTLQNMRDLQAEIDKLTNQNSELTSQNANLTNQKHELEKSMIRANHTIETLSKDIEFSREQAKDLSRQLTVVRSENIALVSDKNDLQKQIVDFEQSHSWQITKPLRSIAWFFRRLFGKTK